jgi:hypothetical protein
LNSFDGRIKANAALVLAGASTAVSVFVTDSADVVLDVNGYFVPAESVGISFHAAVPCRIADTRATAPIRAGQTRTFPMTAGNCSIPASATAYSLNFTAVPTVPLGYLTAWPAGPAMPLASTLNSPTGTVTANAAIVRAGTNGEMSVFATNDTHVVIDINGYFGPPGLPAPLSFYPMTPCRIADTRLGSGTFGGPVMHAAETRSYPVSQSGCGIPATARAYSLNVTVVPQSPLSYLTLWPSDRTQPLVSTLNSFDGSVVSNAAIVPAAANGGVSVFVTGTAHVILDISGYFQ